MRLLVLFELKVKPYCIVLYLQPVLNPKSYDGARVLEASGRPIDETVVSGWNNDALRLRQRMEWLQQKVYAIHKAMDQMNLEESTRSERMEEWIGHVEETLDVLECVPNIEIASRHRPWEFPEFTVNKKKLHGAGARGIRLIKYQFFFFFFFTSKTNSHLFGMMRPWSGDLKA